MLKTIKLFDLEKMFSNKKFKKVTKDNWIYDYEWKMAFKSEKYRQEFLDKMNKAQEDIEAGRVTPWEEFEKEMKEWTY